MRKITVDYLAGIIDGEGCIKIHKYKKSNSYALVIIIEITNSEELMNDIQNNFDGTLSKPRKIKSGKTVYGIWWGGDKVKILLSKIFPYLRLKKQQAEIALGFPTFGQGANIKNTPIEKEYKELQELSYIIMKELNK